MPAWNDPEFALLTAPSEIGEFVLIEYPLLWFTNVWICEGTYADVTAVPSGSRQLFQCPPLKFILRIACMFGRILKLLVMIYGFRIVIFSEV